MKLSLNKNSLKQQRDQLTLFQRFLPSLDLKRQQLMGAWKTARDELAQAHDEISEFEKSLDRLVPLLGSSTLRSQDLSSLVHVRHVEFGEENVVGTRVPVLRRVEFERTPYSTLVLPFWVDQLVENLEEFATLRVQLQVKKQREQRLAAATRTITQRVNLFEKVLIPNARENIKRIRIALSDEERSAVVRSKLAKRKHL